LIEPQDVEPQTPPAQSPQKVISKICDEDVSTQITPCDSLITYDVHVGELGIEVAAGEIGLRSTPRVGVGVAGPDVRWYISRSEVPNLDTRRRPEGGVHAAAIRIESGTVRSGAVRLNTAAVETAAGATVCLGYVRATLTSILVVHWHTTGRAVEGHLVVGVQVHTLVDVNFALIRPVRSNHPAV
jgi:hypothetical protein